jgi:hypothetical protein
MLQGDHGVCIYPPHLSNFIGMFEQKNAFALAGRAWLVDVRLWEAGGFGVIPHCRSALGDDGSLPTFKPKQLHVVGQDPCFWRKRVLVGKPAVHQGKATGKAHFSTDQQHTRKMVDFLVRLQRQQAFNGYTCIDPKNVPQFTTRNTNKKPRREVKTSPAQAPAPAPAPAPAQTQDGTSQA